MLDYGTQKLGAIGQFRFWCQKVLPAVYDDSLSYYELLSKVIEKLNEVIDLVNDEQSGWAAVLAELEHLQQELDDFKDGGFEEVLDEWAKTNLPDFLSIAVKNVWFGINRSGYFVAYVPSSWNEIIFDTGWDYSLDTYGRLILRYDADSPYNVDQQPEPSNY